LNKLAPIAFVLLLSCGAALWFLASDSLNFYIKNQLQTIGTELSQQNVHVESVAIHGYQAIGTITNLRITPSSLSNLSTTAKPTLSIASIDLVIDKESLSGEVIIIESITLHGLNASFHYNENSTSIEKLLASVQQNIQQFMSQEDNIDYVKQDKITARLIKVSKIVVNQGVLQLINTQNQQVISEILPKIELSNVGSEAGSKGETIGVELFEKLLIELNRQTSMIQSKLTKTL
jgi:hypothetical protein